MKIRMKLGDGTFTTADVWWHPQIEIGGIATGGKTVRPAGLWTTDTIIMNHLEHVNAMRRGDCIPERGLSDGDAVIRGIECAEAPLEIYVQGETEEPWRHTGNLIREVPAGDLPAAL